MAALNDPFLEQQILGALLHSPDRAADAVEQNILRPSDFVVPENRLIANAIFDMRTWNRDVSVPGLASWLIQKDQLDLVGGRSYLDDLHQNGGSLDRVNDLLALSSRRDLRELGALISLEAVDEQRSVDQVIDRAEERLFSMRRRGANEVHAIGDFVGNFMDRITKQREGDTSFSFFTRLPALDKVLLGMEKNDFGVIGGRPGDGKSTLIKYLAYLNAIEPPRDQRKGVYIGNFEEGEGLFVMRFIAIMTGISTTLLKNPALLNETHLEHINQAVQHLKQCPLIFDSTSSVSPAVYKSRVMKAARLCRATFGVEMAFNTPDYIQKMVGSGESETVRAKQVSNALRDMAMPDQLNMPVLGTAQLNRTPVDAQGRVREYVMTDLKETGAIEQDASVILFIRRPWILNTPTPETVMQFPENVERDGRPSPAWRTEPVQISIAKNRNGDAPAYTEVLVWHRYCGRYETLNDYRDRTGRNVHI
jgi:replicative DNA helicase